MPDTTPPSELSGLQAFEVRVGARAEQRHPDRPEWVELDGVRVDVTSIDSEWREDGRLGYKVTLRDGKRMLLYYVLDDDLWSGVVQP